MITRRQEKVLRLTRVDDGHRPTGSDVSTMRVLELKGLVERGAGGRYRATAQGMTLPDLPDLSSIRKNRILAYLEEAKDGVQAGEIADHIGIRRTMIYRVLHELAYAGLIEMRPDPSDHRGRRVYIKDRPKAGPSAAH
jgi:uncharacterized protein YjhX (UPF0386 family)